MDIQVRDCVFETNSSSSHAVSISTDDIIDANFPQSVLRSGVIKLVVPVDEDGEALHFENSWKRYYNPENKLLYMLIVAAGGQIVARRWDVDVLPTLTHNYKRARDIADAPPSRCRKRLRDLLAWIKVETGCRVELAFPAPVVIEPSQKIRSIMIGSSQAARVEWVLKEHDALKSLFFNSKSYIETGHDNEQPPFSISTDDREHEIYYADRLVERNDLSSFFTLRVTSAGGMSYADRESTIVIPGKRARFDFYDFVRVNGVINCHFERFDIVLPVYVSSWPKGMEEFDYDLGIENRDRIFDLMNGFVSTVVLAAERRRNGSTVTVKSDIPVILKEEGTSDKVATMAHQCSEFKVRIACDENTRMQVRANALTMMDKCAA